MCLNTPVALFIFNRPDLTEIVFAAIANARPKTLFLVADGPRNAQDAPLCSAARAVVARIDWPCEVRTHFSETNLGCKKRISSGLDWVFSQAEEAIILEDDCLPSQSFFPYCEMMLQRFRDDTRVMHINGFCFAAPDGAASYGFSRYPSVWGWATWRRAWCNYDVAVSQFPGARRHLLKTILEKCADPREAKFWDYSLLSCFRGHAETWDFQWVFACWMKGALAVSPKVNLISNIGIRPDGTHPMDWRPPTPAFELKITTHPNKVEADEIADKIISQKIADEHSQPTLAKRIKHKMKRVISNGFPR